jgi:AcrR family transcriptional regulator
MAEIDDQKTRPEQLASWMDKHKIELADVAIRIIAERGYQALTFRNLAQAAEVSTMTFTYSFQTRDKMLDALIDRVYSRTWVLRGFDRNDDSSDPLGKLRRACQVALQNEPEFDPFQRVLDRFVLEAPYSEKTQAKTNALDQLVEARYINLITLATEQGQADPILDPPNIVQLLWSVGDGMNTQRYANPEIFPPERMDLLFAAAFDYFLGVQGRNQLLGREEQDGNN